MYTSIKAGGKSCVTTALTLQAFTPLQGVGSPAS